MSIFIVTFRVLVYLFTIFKVNVGKRLQYGEIRDQFYLLQLRVWELSLSIKFHFSGLLHFETEVGYIKRFTEIREFDDAGSDPIFHTVLN